MKHSKEAINNETKRSKLSILVVVTLVLALLCTGVGGYLYIQANPTGSPGGEVAITIPPGTTSDQVGELLETKGVISNAQLFRVYRKWKGEPVIQAGKYKIPSNISFDRALEELRKGPQVKTTKVTFPEGFRLTQIAERVAGTLPNKNADNFMKEASSGTFSNKYVALGTKDLQGYLFPDTYYIDETATDRQIIEMMLARFEQIADKLEMEQEAKKLGFSAHDVVTVASMVEREVKLDQDRPPAAGTMYNRLKVGMPLQLDSTATYAAGTFDRETYVVDRKVDSPYNTFKVKGLPPGAISNPGAASLDAALHPTGNYIYFITVNDCTNETVFTVGIKEFNQAVARRARDNPKTCS